MTAARQPRPGELSLVPDVPRQVRQITLTVEQLDGGILRFTQPRVPGFTEAGQWTDVVRILRRAFTDRQLAAYAEWRGSPHDHPAAPQYRRSKPRSRGKRRKDTYDPLEWLVRDDGSWVSPRGRIYRADSQCVDRIKKRRREAGMPEFPCAEDGRQRLEREIGTQLGLPILVSALEETAS